MFYFLFMSVSVLLWALGIIAVRSIIGPFPLFTMLSSSYGIAAGLLLIIAAIRSNSPTIRARDIVTILITGVLRITIFWALFAQAQLLTSSARATAMALTMPLMVPPIEMLVRRKWPQWSYALVVLTGCAGLYFLIMPYWSLPAQMQAAMFCLIASMSWSISLVFERLRPIEGDPQAALGWQMILAAILLSIVSIIKSESFFPADVNMGYWLWYIFLVFGVMTGLNVIFYSGSNAVDAPYEYFVLPVLPLTVAGLSVPLLGQMPTLYDWLGIGLLFVSSTISVFFAIRAARQVRDALE